MKENIIRSFIFILIFVLGITGVSLAKTGEIKDSDFLNLREKPTTDSEILVKMPQDAKFEILDDSDYWYRVQYKNYTGYGFGYLNEKFESWSKFLDDEIKYSSLTVNPYIPDNSNVYKCINILEKYPFDKKLLHGDFGTHNFVKENGKLIGVIDPMPIIGDPLYDLLFAIVSNKDILKNITLEKIYSLANEPKEKINAMLTIVLYSRIARCIKYQPQDIDTYLNYWNKFKI